MTSPDLAILACYAHPDDEQGITGYLKRCHDQGIRTAILCSTRGEVGEIADPTLATPETLGAVREDELRSAAAVVNVDELFFLDYRDSGMRGTPPNQDPRAFINAEPHKAIGDIVRVIRTFKPTVVVTFDETGAYGHPDHIAIYHWTKTAFAAAGDPTQYPEMGAPFQPARLFYASVARSFLRYMSTIVEQMGIHTVFTKEMIEHMGLPDEWITNRINVAESVLLKRRSLEMHKTQLNPNSVFSRLPEEQWNAFRAVENYSFAAGVPFPAGADDQDLFAGLR
jgi:LmbE family N-acetylglucosaminyl deacetylase